MKVFEHVDASVEFAPRGGIASLTITEPTAGSDAAGMRTEFRPEGDSIVVNGTKTFITNGAHADLYMLFGKWSEIDGEPGDGLDAVKRSKEDPEPRDAKITQIWEGTNQIHRQFIGRSFITRT